MAKLTDPGEDTLKADGAATVKSLTRISAELFPLREKAKSGKPLTKRQQAKLDRLEADYRLLETTLRELMRPRDPNPWLRGADHSHSKH